MKAYISFMLVLSAAVLTIAGCGDDRPLPDNPATTPGGDLHYAYAVALDEQCRCDDAGDYAGCPEFRFPDHASSIECADQLWSLHEDTLASAAACHEEQMLKAAECFRSRGCGAFDECLTQYEADQLECSGTWFDLGPFMNDVWDCANS